MSNDMAWGFFYGVLTAVCITMLLLAVVDRLAQNRERARRKSEAERVQSAAPGMPPMEMERGYPR